MANIKYMVEVEYLSKGTLNNGLQQASKTAGGLQSNLGFAKHAVAGISGTIVGATAGLAAAAASASLLHLGFEMAGGALAFIVDGITGINSLLEGAQIAFAGVFQSTGVVSSFNQGMSVSAELLAQMRKDAAALPGTFEDLLKITQTIAIPSIASGMSPKGMEALAAKAMAVGIGVSRLDPALIGRELAHIMEGSAQSRMPLAMKLAQVGGKSIKEMNDMFKKSPEEGIKYLERVLGKFDEAIAAYGKTWDAISTAALDNIKTIQLFLTESIFSKLKDTLNNVNKWFSENKDVIQLWSQFIGQEFGKVYDVVESVVSKIANKLGWIAREQGPAGFLRGVERFLIGGTTILGGIGVGAGMGATAGGGIGGLIGAILGSVFPGIGTAIGGALGTAGGALVGGGVGAAAGGATGAGIFGIFSGLMDPNSPLHKQLKQDVRALFNTFSGVFDEFKRLWENVRAPLLNIAETMGHTLLDAIVNFGQVLMRLLEQVNLFLESPTGRLILNLVPPRQDEHVFGIPGKKIAGEYEKTSPRHITPPTHNTYINKVEIQVNSNQDPSRIARLTLEEINKIANRPSTKGLNSGRPYFSGTLK